ncbi:MAG TPA: hypothetical protein VN113_05160 [Caulobacter sp.]|nr:hypothetical protein [Caulobacter sp.]HWU13975.1 hypothetical protein [Caulobacter sp.]
MRKNVERRRFHAVVRRQGPQKLHLTAADAQFVLRGHVDPLGDGLQQMPPIAAVFIPQHLPRRLGEALEQVRRQVRAHAFERRGRALGFGFETIARFPQLVDPRLQ